MMDEHEKRGWTLTTFSSKSASVPSVVIEKEGHKKIVLHYTTIGGYQRYYCMVFAEDTEIEGHPYKREVNA